MAIQSKKESIILFLGDVFLLYLSLFLMLYLSYLGLPKAWLVADHINAFSIIIALWILVFFIAGLYEKHTVIFKGKLPNIILNAQLINTALAVLFFYLIPYFGITPKTNLFIYLIISFGLILAWRIYGYPRLGTRKREKAIIIGNGDELKELIEEVNNNNVYSLYFISYIDLDKTSAPEFEGEINRYIKENNISTVVVDLDNEKVKPITSTLSKLIYSNVEFIEKQKVYEDIFNRVPLSLLNDNWFIQNISLSPKPSFDSFKRLMDIFISIFLGILALIISPIIIALIKAGSSGPSIIIQERMGKDNKIIKVSKFRTMERDTSGDEVMKDSKNKITKIGRFLRKSRIDELPQLWSVLKGDLSLIGPRPEFPSLVDLYTKEVSYYNIRHLVKPGLAGWAQLYHDNHPHHGTNVSETGVKLSYDLYYIKNRSIMLELQIALRTIKTLISRTGV
jgi:exopolysaccharide biosynthesis polyprenyl glycosylphosphotransferase